MKFRKKPVEIEARQYTGTDESRLEIREWIGDSFMYVPGEHYAVTIRTLEGQHVASPGDWIIRGVKGEFYPCKPDIFAATYEPAVPPSSQEAPADGLEAAFADPAGAVRRVEAVREFLGAPAAEPGERETATGTCSVAMWGGDGSPAGLCGAPAYGRQAAPVRGEPLPPLAIGLACPSHGGPAAPRGLDDARGRNERAGCGHMTYVPNGAPVPIRCGGDHCALPEKGP